MNNKYNKYFSLSLIITGISLIGFVIYQDHITKSNNKTLPTGEVLLGGDKVTAPQPLIEGVNKIVINKIGVEAEILEGGEEALAEGVWHLPRTADPGTGGNFVVSSHRWKYLPPDPRTFYDLDKLEIGDMIEVTWAGEVYKYVVQDIFVVTPDRVDILAPSDDNILTLFTCTPLYSTDRRLVIKASLVE